MYHPTTNRWIVDMGDLGGGLMIHTPGQSGHAGSPHYDDFIETWRRGQYHPSYYDRKDVEANRRGRLLLSPAQANAP